MTEKTYTVSEINELTNKLWLQYVEHYRADKMSFNEYVIIENIIMKIQYLFENGGEVFE